MLVKEIQHHNQIHKTVILDKHAVRGTGQDSVIDVAVEEIEEE